MKGRNNKVVVVEADQRTYGSAGSRDVPEWREGKVQQSGKPGVTYTTTGEKCAFPFVYRGKTYHECTRIDHHSKWCSTTSNYDGKWGHCAAEGTRVYARKRSLDRKKEDVAVKSKREAGNDIRTINFDQSYSDKRQDDDFQGSQGDGTDDGSSGMDGASDEDVSEDDITDDEGDDINDEYGNDINDDKAEIYGSDDISSAGEHINGDVYDINGNNGGSDDIYGSAGSVQ